MSPLSLQVQKITDKTEEKVLEKAARKMKPANRARFEAALAKAPSPPSGQGQAADNAADHAADHAAPPVAGSLPPAPSVAGAAEVSWHCFVFCAPAAACCHVSTQTSDISKQTQQQKA
jgi:hypothetical protein